MKKIIAICMAALLLLAALPVSLVLADVADNEGNPIVISGSVDKAAVCAGKTVTLTVNMAQNPGLAGWNVQAYFDKDAFELVSITGGPIFPAGGMTYGAVDNPAATPNPTVSNGVASATYTGFISPDVTGDGVLFTAVLKAKDTAVAGDYEIALGTMNGYLDNFSDQLMEKVFDVTFGTVAIKVGHNYTESITKEADCGNAGVKTFTCECGDSYTEEISATGAHTYANDCDADCNVCGATRTPADHVYDNACDADCNVCGASREAASHVYDNACDADCNVCGATRTPADHKSDAAFACQDGKCTECGADVAGAGHAYTYACDAHCKFCGELTNAEASHKVGKVEAHDSDCHRDGNVEYWTCAHCGAVWLDEAMTLVSNHKSIIVPAKGGEVKHVEAKAATVDAEGNIEYWFCETCEQFWTDEALTQLTNSKSVILPKLEPAPAEPTTKPDDTQDPTKPMGENVVVILVSGLIALIAAAAVVLFSKKKA